MANFSATAELEAVVTDESLRTAKSDIERELQDDIAVDVDADANVSSMAADGGGGGEVQSTLSENLKLDEERNDILRELLDEFEAGGGGGGGGSGLSKLLGLGGLALGLGGLGGILLKGLDDINIEPPNIPPLEVPEIPPVSVAIPDPLDVEVPDIDPIEVLAPDFIPVLFPDEFNVPGETPGETTTPGDTTTPSGTGGDVGFFEDFADRSGLSAVLEGGAGALNWMGNNPGKTGIGIGALTLLGLSMASPVPGDEVVAGGIFAGTAMGTALLSTMGSSPARAATGPNVSQSTITGLNQNSVKRFGARADSPRAPSNVTVNVTTEGQSSEEVLRDITDAIWRELKPQLDRYLERGDGGGGSVGSGQQVRFDAGV